MSDETTSIFALRCVQLREEMIKLFETNFNSPQEIIAVLTSLISAICLNEKKPEVCLQQTIDCITMGMMEMAEGMKNDGI